MSLLWQRIQVQDFSSGDLLPDVRMKSADVRTDVTTKGHIDGFPLSQVKVGSFVLGLRSDVLGVETFF